MRLRFCENTSCGNILTSYIKNNELLFRCVICLDEYPSNDDDTLIIDEFMKEDETLYKHQIYLKNAAKDPLAKLIKKKCTNKYCKETIVKVVSVDVNGQSIFVCPSCDNKFYDTKE